MRQLMADFVETAYCIRPHTYDLTNHSEFECEGGAIGGEYLLLIVSARIFLD